MLIALHPKYKPRHSGERREGFDAVAGRALEMGDRKLVIPPRFLSQRQVGQTDLYAQLPCQGDSLLHGGQLFTHNMNNENTAPKPLINIAAVMKLLGYRSPWGLMRFVRAHGVPFIQLNACRIMFDQDKLQAWLDARTSPQPTKRAAVMLLLGSKNQKAEREGLFNSVHSESLTR